MKERMTVTVDREALEGAKMVLRETGVTLSGFINLTLHGLLASYNKPMKEMYEDMAIGLMREVTKGDHKPKRRKK